MAENEETHDNDNPTQEDAVTRIEAAVTGLLEREEAQSQETERRIGDAVDRLAKVAPSTPSKVTTNQRIQISDRFDMLGYQRGDFELAMMMFDATHHITRPINLEAPEDLKKAWQYHVFEAEGPRPGVVDAKTGRFMRAMDTAESGFGLELVGQQYVQDLWQAAKNDDSIVNAIRQIPMTFPTTFLPIDGGLPEMFFVGESTTEGESNYPTSKVPSNRRQLDAKKFTIQAIWSAELDEDSIIAFVPFLREQLNRSATLHLGSAIYNGDVETGGTGNINKDDGAPAGTKHYLAFNGVRRFFLVDSTGQGKDMNGVLDTSEIWKARGKLNGADDDVDAAVKNINWGKDPRALLLVCDYDTFMNLHDQDEVITVDKYGPKATVVTGELGSFHGVPVVAPSYASKTEADGKASDTEGNNTKGQLTLFNPKAWTLGVRRDVQMFADRIQRTDQLLIELYLRVGLQRFGDNVAAGIYNITV